MDYRTKHLVAVVVLFISTCCAVYGYSRLRGEVLAGYVPPITPVLLFGGCIIGITAGLFRIYFGSRLHYDNGKRIAVETLAATGKKHKKQ